jgi:hypothetical protein
MANKGPSYGMSRQVQDKIASKYDPELEQILVEWLSRQCGSGVGKPEAGKIGFQAWLKDGCVSFKASIGLHRPCLTPIAMLISTMYRTVRQYSNVVFGCTMPSLPLLPPPGHTPPFRC